MIRKILLILLIIIIWYILIIFKLPLLGDSIAKAFWLEKFNKLVVSIWNIYTNVVTDLPNEEEFINNYEDTVSWAILLKDKVVNWLDDAKSFVDNIRVNLSWAGDFVDEVTNKVWDIEDKYNEVTDALWDTVNTVNNVIDNLEIVPVWSPNSWDSSSTGEITNTWELN